jgi:hypothetical protein
VSIDDRVEILRPANHDLASDDRLDAIFGDAVARQDSFAREAKGDDLATTGRVRLEFGKDAPAYEHDFVAWSAWFAKWPPRLDLDDTMRHFVEKVG